MNRTDIINAVIAARKAVSYLEIGVRNPAHNFDRIKVEYKLGIDPAAKPSDELWRMTSDDAFIGFVDSVRFDVIFIDGDHGHEQVFRDLVNAERFTSKGGAIVMHDCLPLNQAEAAPTKPNNGAAWCGGAWAAAAAWLESGRQGFIVDCDHGVAVFSIDDRRKKKALKPTTLPPPWQGGLADWTITPAGFTRRMGAE